MRRRVPILVAFLVCGCGGGGGGDEDTGTDSGIDTSVDTAVDPGSEPAVGHDCTNPHPDWILCEDFESYADHVGDFEGWYDASEWNSIIGLDDRGRIDMDGSEVHGGDWALHMPAA